MVNPPPLIILILIDLWAIVNNNTFWVFTSKIALKRESNKNDIY